MFVITDCDNKLIMFCEMKHDCLNESAPKPNDSLPNVARAAQDTIAIAWRSRSRSRKYTTPERVQMLCMEDGQLLNKRMKDKITVTRNDLRVTTTAIYFAC